MIYMCAIVIVLITFVVIMIVLSRRHYMYLIQKICEKELCLSRLQANFYILDKWLEIRNKGIRLSDALEREGYKSVAIYGVGEIGIGLFEELGGTGCSVAYCIDKKNALPQIKTYSPDDILPNADAIIVTVTCDYNEIERQLRNKVKCPIIPIESLLCEGL